MGKQSDRLLRAGNLFKDKEFRNTEKLICDCIAERFEKDMIGIIDQIIDVDEFLIVELPKFVREHIGEYLVIQGNSKVKARKATHDFLKLHIYNCFSVDKVSSTYGIQAMFDHPGQRNKLTREAIYIVTLRIGIIGIIIK